MSNYLHKILVTGGGGQLANALQSHAKAKDFQLTFVSHQQMDITKPTSIANAITQHEPDIIINTAAYTAVDKAESEPDIATSVNHLGALELAMASEKHSIPLIHLSTDYVFAGEKNRAYTEEDEALPLSVYGESKWLGEEAIRHQIKNHIILRVSGIFSEYGNNFVKTMLRLANEKEELRIVDDQITCPTYAGDIAGVLFSILKNTPIWGTYHYCSNTPISWHAFAVAIIEEAKKQSSLKVKKITAIPTKDYPTPAKRPLNAVLDCSKIKTHFDIVQTNCLDIIPSLLKKIK